MGEIDRRLAELSPTKAALLRARLQRRDQACLANSRIGHGGESTAPLSFAQERIWLHQQLTPDSTAYHRPANLRLRGPLQLEALRLALEDLAARHDALRAVVVEQDGRAELSVAKTHSVELPDIDLRPHARPQAEARRLAAAAALTPFDLRLSPPMRAQLLRLADQDWLLLLTFHHFVFDAWSQSILTRELAEAYQARSAGGQPAWESLPIGFADYARWERKLSRKSALEGGRVYWKSQLDKPPVLRLPTDYHREKTPSEGAAYVEFVLPAELVAQLRDLGRQANTTMFSVLLAAYAVLLHRAAKEEDVVIGCPVAGRLRQEVEALVGVFINTLPLRIRIDSAEAFQSLLERVATTVLNGLQHQETPLQWIVQDVLTLRDPTVATLFQTIFVHERFASPTPQAAGVRFQAQDSHAQATLVDLSLEVTESEEGVCGSFGFRHALWERSSIEALASQYAALLHCVAQRPRAPVSQLSLLAPSEREIILQQWSIGPSRPPSTQTVCEQIAQRAAESPLAPAVVSSDGRRTLTYEELEARSTQLACQLQDLGVRSESRVLLLASRSPDVLCALLAILKAGAAFVPVDADGPVSRLDAIVSDAEPQVAIAAHDGQALRLRDSCYAGPIIVLEHAMSRRLAGSRALIPPSLEAAAYVIYTSGSTGKPNGVVVEHRSLANLCLIASDLYRIKQSDRVLQFAPLTFDACLEEIFPTWVSGAALVLRSQEAAESTSRLFDQMRARGVTVVSWPTAYWRVACEDLAAGEALSETLRLVIIGGEAADVDSLRTWRQHVGCRVGLLNTYGPTETTVIATAADLTTEPAPFRNTVPIGRPLTNAQVFVLDPEGQPTPVGVAGELHIAGDGVARGYLNRPDLTARKFVAHPFSTDKGARLYRTGDICRWRSDASLEFLGRTDDQVKHRGFRIELSEIEYWLTLNPSVRQSVATLREDRPGDTRLVAYFVPSEDATADGSDLREYLESRLPQYMVPQHFVELDELPLNASGKVDRRALPPPTVSAAPGSPASAAPQTETERRLAEIWADVLGLPPSGVDDNFFALGGHSLLAVKLAARIKDAFGVQAPLSALFSAPTIASQARLLEELGSPPDATANAPPSDGTQTTGTIADGPSGADPSCRDSGSLGAPCLSFAQEQLWFLEQLEGDLAAYNLPFAWRLRGPLRTEVLEQAFQQLLERHAPLRTAITVAEGRPVPVIGRAENFRLELEDLAQVPGDCREEAIQGRTCDEAERKFDLSQGPMLRGRLLRLGPELHVLLVTIHHLAADGWSVPILWRELSLFYDALQSECATSLAALPIQYAEYAERQRSELQGERLEALLRYWRPQLEGLAPLQLPCDRPRTTVPGHQGARVDFQLDEPTISRLRRVSQAEGATIHMTLLAAFAALLSRYTSQQDIAVALPVAGRPDANLERLVGFFVNTLIIRVQLSPGISFRSLMQRVRSASLAAYDQQELPYAKLIEELRPERNQSRNPLVQVLFQSLNYETSQPTFAGVETTRLAPAVHRARFELEMHMRLQPEKLEGGVVFDADLFEPATIQRMVGHYQRLLTAALANPDEPVSRLPLLSDVERQLLAAWNDTRVPYPNDKSLADLFEAQAARAPDRTALIAGDCELTYRELNKRANQLARFLVGRGVGDETVVAVCLPRTPRLVVALLAILKAGGAYLALDASDPVERRNWMLADSGAVAVLAERDSMSDLAGCATPLFALDQNEHEIEALPSENLRTHAQGRSLAYLMYTSGSTGVPKAAAVQHKSVSRLVFGTHYAEFGEDRVWVQLAPVSFDAATLEIWGALLHGSRLVLPEEGLLDPDALGRLLWTQGVTTLWLTASWFNRLIEERPHVLASVEEILTGGEALSPKHIRMAQQHLPPATRLTNGYGPTECTTFACCYSIPPGVSEDESSIPIGRPIANTTAYVLDPAGQQAPVGVSGELYLGGDGLARGYWNRPELTDERFVANPFSDDAQARLYRTGDLCRWRADGNLEFLGRLDDQVKLRGYRIELGEIESALRRRADLSEAAVALTHSAAGDQQLVAYCVVAPGSNLDPVALSQDLRRSLPAYMVPSAFVALDRLPLTASGKVNRRSLAAYTPSGLSDSLADSSEPQTALQRDLARIWRQVLGREAIGVRSSFFDLGGHSLLAMKLLFQIESQLGFSQSIKDFFADPTIEGQSRLLSSDRQTELQWTAVRETGDHAGRELVPLVIAPSLFGEIWEWRPFLEQIDFDRQIYGIELAGDRPYWQDNLTLEEIARPMTERILRELPGRRCHLLGHSFGGYLAFEIGFQLECLGAPPQSVTLVDTAARVSLPPPRRASGLVSLAANAPLWLWNEMTVYGPLELARRVRRRLWSGSSAAKREQSQANRRLEQVFDLDNLPSMYRERLRQGYAALAKYRTRSTQNQLIYLRSRIRPLLQYSRRDGGWSSVAPSARLLVRVIPGDHGRPLDRRWWPRLGPILKDALRTVE